MFNPEPEVKTQILLSIFQQYQIPAIINIAGGGLQAPEEYDMNLFHFVDRIPYDWVLPKIYAMIHHGGSGTTHMSLKNGCATMILPHIIDQYFWNDLNSELGCGPKGIAINKVTKANLAPKIVALWKNTTFKNKAIQLARQMQAEDFEEILYQSVLTTSSLAPH